MRRAKVESGAIRSVGYDETSRELEIEFRNGTYRYFPVPRQVFEAMLLSESVGAFVEHRVKGHFIYRRIEGRNQG